MADYLLELRKSIDDQKKRTAILKPSAKAAQERQYGMTDGGGKARTAANTSMKPTTAWTGQQSLGLLKPSVQAAREKQYGMTDSGGGIAGAAVKQAAARTAQTTVIKPSAKAAQEKQYGMTGREDTRTQSTGNTESTAVVSTPKTTISVNRNSDPVSGRKNDPVAVARNRALEAAQSERKAFSRLQARAVEEMELYRTDSAARQKAMDRYKSYSGKIAAAEDVIRRATESTAADWEAQKAAEIQAAGGNELLLQLMRLDELETRIIKETAELGEDRRTEYGTGLTENQQRYNAMYRALSVLYGSEEVSSWLEYVDRRRNSDQMAKNLEKAASIAEEYPFWSSVGSIPLNMFSGFGYLDVAGQNLQRFATGSDAPIDYNSPAQTPSRMTNTIRGTVSKDMSGGEKFLYNTAMSMGDSALAMTMGNFGMGLLGGAAATNATHAAAERGATDGQALLVGLVAGATETLMEKVSIESLFNLKTPGAARGLVYNVLKQAGVEGTEEGLTTIVNTIADGLIMRDKSELETIKRNLMANGASREEAELAAIQVWSKEFALDVAGGFLSGAAFGTVKSGADYIGASQLQQKNTAPGKETGTENIVQKPRVSMADFTNPQSSVFRNLAYDDTVTQLEIMQQTHQDMVKNGSVVSIPEGTLTWMESYYPDLRGMKKQERTPILKQKITELKTDLRKFLTGLRDVNFEFEVNGNILDARLYDTGIREVMEKVTKDKASMIRHSDDIFRKAQYLYSTPDYDGDPNVYRWNYFYTPVQIGEETVGVRIAVRDVATPQESQIYNWGIKKDAVLGGGRPGVNPNTTGASSSASSGTTLGGGGRGRSRIPNGASSVTSNDSIDIPVEIVNGGVGDMRAVDIGKAGGAAEEEYLAFVRRLEEVQVHLKAEELRQAYLRNMARLEEAEREAELDAAFWKGFDR